MFGRGRASIPDGAIALGSHLYLFRSQGPSSECVVVAHGGYRRENRMFRVPDGVSIAFYALHGESLNGVSNQMLGQADMLKEAVEYFTGGQDCINYFVERDNDVGDINEVLTFNAQARERFRTGFWDKGRALNPIEVNALNRAAHNAKPRHVVILRSHKEEYTTSLSYVIEKVRKEAPEVRLFHCRFCRSPLFPGAEPPVRRMGNMDGVEF